MKPIAVAITGASGAGYARRLLDVLLRAGETVHLTMSAAAVEVMRVEEDVSVDLREFVPAQLLPESTIATHGDRLRYFHLQDFSAGIASGSFQTKGMVICPCSGGTMSAIANGLSANLIHRAADVHLKERRKLILVPRETPLSTIQLGNMLKLSEAGAVILPAMPGFYHQPKSIDDLIDFVVARLCDQLEVEVDLSQRWGTD